MNEGSWSLLLAGISLGFGLAHILERPMRVAFIRGQRLEVLRLERKLKQLEARREAKK